MLSFWVFVIPQNIIFSSSTQFPENFVILFFTAEEYSIVYIYNIFIIHPLDQLKDIKVAFIS